MCVSNVKPTVILVLEFIRVFFPFLIHGPLLGYLLWNVYQTQAAAPLRRYFWAGAILKLLAGTVVGLLYLYHYPYRGDTWVLFDESALLSKLAFRNPLAYLRTLLLNDVAYAQHEVFLTLSEQPRAFFMAKLLSLVNLFTFGNYWITGFYCSLFSFWGLWLLANRLVVQQQARVAVAAMACLFVPSVVFWSSGVLKETIAVGCLGLVLAGLLALTHRPAQKLSFPILVGMGLSLWLLWKLKFYYAGLLLPVCMAWVFSVFFYQRYPTTRLRTLRWIQLLAVAALLNLMPLAYQWLTGQSLLESLVLNHDATVQASRPGTFVVFSQLQPTLASFLRHFPLALWSGCFAPLPWQASGGLAWATSLENSLLLLAFVVSVGLAFRKRPGFATTGDTISRALFRQSMWQYCLLLAVLLAFASPNFGALARYKAGFLPILVFLLLDALFSDRRRQATDTNV